MNAIGTSKHPMRIIRLQDNDLCDTSGMRVVYKYGQHPADRPTISRQASANRTIQPVRVVVY
jgi:hypothetical protein